jgi:hypothetical protein
VHTDEQMRHLPVGRSSSHADVEWMPQANWACVATLLCCIGPQRLSYQGCAAAAGLRAHCGLWWHSHKHGLVQPKSPQHISTAARIEWGPTFQSFIHDMENITHR